MNKVALKNNITGINNNRKAIDLLYEAYLEKVLAKEIIPHSSHTETIFAPKGKLNIFKAYFQKRTKTISTDVESYLIDFLDDNISKWFVTHFLQEVDSYSEDLMKALLETGIKILDPQRINCFVISANRIHKSKTSDYLTERFQKSTDREKGGILRMFYWVQLDVESQQYEHRIAMLLNEYAKTNDAQLKQFISSELPSSLSNYPENLKNEGTIYLENIVQ